MANTNKTIFEIKKRINNYYDHSHVFGLEVKNRRFFINTDKRCNNKVHKQFKAT